MLILINIVLCISFLLNYFLFSLVLLFQVLGLYTSAACIFQLGYIYVMVMGVADEFTRFNNDFSEAISFDDRGCGNYIIHPHDNTVYEYIIQ